MGIHSKNYVYNSVEVIYHIAYSLEIFGKYRFRRFLINRRTDFRLGFADFRNFSGPYGGHTYSPPQKIWERTDGPSGIKKTRTDTDCI